MKLPHDDCDAFVPSLAKPIGRQKPMDSQFLDEAHRAIEGGHTKGLKSIQKLLKKGVSAKSALGPLIDSLFEVLKDWTACSQLAIRLSVETRSKRSSDLIRNLRNRLIFHARAIVGFPESLHLATDDMQFPEPVEVWLNQLFENDAAKTKDSSISPSNLDRARWAAVCLMEGPLILRTEGIYRLLHILCFRCPFLDVEETESLFFSEVCSLLSVDKPNAGKLTSGMKFAAGARSHGTVISRKLRLARAVIGRQESRILELDSNVTALGDSLANATKGIGELEAQVAKTSEQIEEQKLERHLDSEHLKTLADQQLTRRLNEISVRLAHEINEAKICLDGEKPNIAMALDRLRQMERALAKLRGV